MTIKYPTNFHVFNDKGFRNKDIDIVIQEAIKTKEETKSKQGVCRIDDIEVKIFDSNIEVWKKIAIHRDRVVDG